MSYDVTDRDRQWNDSIVTSPLHVRCGVSRTPHDDGEVMRVGDSGKCPNTIRHIHGYVRLPLMNVNATRKPYVIIVAAWSTVFTRRITLTTPTNTATQASVQRAETFLDAQNGPWTCNDCYECSKTTGLIRTTTGEYIWDEEQLSVVRTGQHSVKTASEKWVPQIWSLHTWSCCKWT